MKGLLLIGIAAFLWALDTLIRYPMLSTMPAALLVVREQLILTAFTLPVVIRSWGSYRALKKSDLLWLGLIGALGQGVGTLAFTEAFRWMNPSSVILLQKLQPVFAICLARVMLKEEIKKSYVAWAMVCLLGALLISSPHFQTASWDFQSDAAKGLLLTLIAVASWGSCTVLGKRLSNQGLGTLPLMGARFTLGLLFMLLVAPLLFAGARFTPAEIAGAVHGGLLSWGKIGALATLSGLLALFFYYQGLKALPARVVTLAEMLFPFFAVILNWIFLDVSLQFTQLVGGALLLLGSTVIQLRDY